MRSHLIFAALAGTVPAISACATEEFDESIDLTASTVDETTDLGEAAAVAAEQAGEAEALAAAAGEVEADAKAKGKASFRDNGLTLTLDGKFEDFGKKGDLFFKLTAKATAIAKCTNPGGNEPPGQNPVVIKDFEVSGSVTVPLSDLKYGTASVMLTTKPPRTVIPGAPDCPNPKWKETIVDLKFTKCLLIIRQDNKRVLLMSCAFDKPTDDGPVHEKKVTCIES